MKAKDLIKILQLFEPDKNVSFSLGSDEEYQDKCAQAQLVWGGCMDVLSVDFVSIIDAGQNETWFNIVLKQDSYNNLDEAAKKFNEQYTEL